MRVVIVGCGRFGAELAARLFQRGHEVSVVDANEDSFARLPSNFEGRINAGDALDRDVLHRAGIEKADAVAVVTDSDILNGVVGYLIRTYYEKSNVVVRNHDPRYRPILEAYGLQMISALAWGAQRLEEMLYHADVHTVFSAGNGEVEIYEISVPEDWNGHMLGDMLTNNTSIPVAVTRAGRAMLPSPEFILQAGDVVHVSANLEGVMALRKRLHLLQQEG
jgi:trk system potassium uptake protein TrkA